MTSTPSIAHNDKYTRLNYVRYADDFIIGVEGSRKQTEDILKKVTQFVENELSLQFNPDKTGITNYANKPIKFLGYTIAAPHLKGTVKPMESIKTKDKTIMRRKKIRMRIHMDTQKVLKKLLTKGLVKLRTSHQDHNSTVYKGKFLGNLINLDHADIIRYYNSVIRGLHNYYDFVGNRNDILYII